MQLSEIIINPDNPRIKDVEAFEKLCISIMEFPQMMELRPIVIDENNISLGGNRRAEALQQIFSQGAESLKRYLAEVDKQSNFDYFDNFLQTGLLPASWVIRANELSEAQKQEFIIKDNVSFARWDEEILKNDFEISDLEKWNLDISPETMPTISASKTDDDYIEQLNQYNDENCEMPIVPEFFEKHECFIIPVHNEIDENFIRDIFNLNVNHVSKSGDGKIRKTNVINIETIRQWTMKSK